jgi:hypothetical protein
MDIPFYLSIPLIPWFLTFIYGGKVSKRSEATVIAIQATTLPHWIFWVLDSSHENFVLNWASTFVLCAFGQILSTITIRSAKPIGPRRILWHRILALLIIAGVEYAAISSFRGR